MCFLESLHSKFTKAIFLALILTIIYNLPIAYWDQTHFCTPLVDLVMQLSVVFTLSSLLFLLLAFLPYIGPFITIILFISSGLVVYFLFSFGKILDPGVVHDILTVESDLTYEYLSWEVVITAIVSALIPFFACTRWRYGCTKIFIGIFLLSAIIGSYFAISDGKKVEVTVTKYNPVNLLYSLQILVQVYGPESQKMHNRQDLTEQYRFSYEGKDNEPLIIIYILGESMRGDINGLNGYHINNMPRLKQRKNLVSLSNARSVATNTRESLPFMLTRALAGNEEQTQTEKGIISVYRKLGFNTSWIGNQGIFGSAEIKYAANALEAEKIITHREVKRLLGRKGRMYDGELLPFVYEHLDSASNDNHFMIFHMYGSHWHFEQRYPKDFPTIVPLQKDTCDALCPRGCTREDFVGSYHNSIMYSDYVIDQIIEHVADKNAIVFFSSDHGQSLGDNGVVGNAASGENIPPEQLDVELFIWGSDKFIQSHPHMLKTIRDRSDELYTNDKLFYTILDCSGVETELMVDEYSLCSKKK